MIGSKYQPSNKERVDKKIENNKKICTSLEDNVTVRFILSIPNTTITNVNKDITTFTYGKYQFKLEINSGSAMMLRDSDNNIIIGHKFNQDGSFQLIMEHLVEKCPDAFNMDILSSKERVVKDSICDNKRIVIRNVGEYINYVPMTDIYDKFENTKTYYFMYNLYKFSLMWTSSNDTLYDENGNKLIDLGHSSYQEKLHAYLKENYMDKIETAEIKGTTLTEFFSKKATIDQRQEVEDATVK